MKVGILTLGCKVNTYESEFIANKLKDAGYEIVDFNDLCDVYIINTCTVTNTSDVKSRKMIRQAIRKNKDACIVAMGCFIEANHDFRMDGLDIVIGNKDKSKIVEILEEYFQKRKEIRDLYEEEYKEFEDMDISDFPGRTRAFVKIQDGCENFCSYCIIPYVRGKCRSKDKNKVIKEVNSLIQNGYYEIVLTGIHTGNYGVDIDTDFATILEEICKLEGLKRLRISSIEITELTDKVLEVLKKYSVIVDHLHIPLQAGSDEVLKQMNRKYDLSYFYKKIEAIRKIRPQISITTDIIVGHPGETDEMFEKTLETARNLKFAKIHVFPYSVRKGTASASMKQIDGNEKKKRAQRLLALSRQLEQEYFESFRGKKVEVLIETTKESTSFGHTGNFLPVKINKELKHNTFYNATITKIEYPYCIGK